MFPMFALLCACPVSAEPSDVDQLSCLEDFGQIQKVILQRRFSTGTTLNQIAFAGVTLEATWQALVDATDSTKVVWSNELGDPQSTPGEPLLFGSGNQVPNGAPQVVGEGFSQMAFVMYSYTQAIVKQMKNWGCELASVFFVNSAGQIAGHIDDPAAPANFRGFPIQKKTMFVGSKKFGGYGNPDSNVFQFSLPPNWSDNFYVVTPEATFDALEGIY